MQTPRMSDSGVTKLTQVDSRQIQTMGCRQESGDVEEVLADIYSSHHCQWVEAVRLEGNSYSS